MPQSQRTGTHPAQRELAAEIGGYQRVIDGARAVAENYRPHITVDPEWPLVALGEVIKTITPPLKIPASDFNDNGKYPVIDQSQNAVAGRTNNESALIDGESGLVIFGDHTCCVKFVAEKFAQGADGIKIISPMPQLDAKFLYCYLLSHPISAAGYKRHFRELQETPIPLPPLGVQQAIAGEIAAEQGLVAASRELAGRMAGRMAARIGAAVGRAWGGGGVDRGAGGCG